MSIVIMKNIVLVRDYYVKIGETCLDKFLFQHELERSSKEPACFKTAYNSRCIAFILR